MKRRPCCFPKPVLWELSSFRISKLLFLATKIGVAADNVWHNALIQNCLGFWIWMWIPYQLNLDSRFQSLAGFRIPWAQFWIPKPRTSDSKRKNSLYSRGILVILHAWGGIDCKTVRIRAYSSSASSQTKGLEDWKKEIVRKIGCDRSEPNLENQVGPSRFNINYTLQVYGSFCNLYFQSKAFEVFWFILSC